MVGTTWRSHAVRVNRRPLVVTASCLVLAVVLIVWMVSLGSDDPGRTDRVVKAYARQMEYPPGESWVREEALEWADYVCSLKVDDEGLFLANISSTVDDFIEIADAGCPDKAREFRSWKAANPDDD